MWGILRNEENEKQRERWKKICHQLFYPWVTTRVPFAASTRFFFPLPLTLRFVSVEINSALTNVQQRVKAGETGEIDAHG